MTKSAGAHAACLLGITRAVVSGRRPSREFRLPLVAVLALGLSFGQAVGANAPSGAPGVGEPFRAFAAPDLNGRMVDVPSLLKDKVGLVTFWASWCKPCVEEIPKLKDLNDRFRHQGLVVVGIGLQEGGETPAKQRQMAARMLMSYPLIFDQQKEYETAYGLGALPLNVLVGADGKVLWKDVTLPEDLGTRIESLLREAPRAGGGK